MSEATQAQREEAKRQAEIYDQDEKYMLAVIMWREACNEDNGTWPLEDTLIAWLVDRLTPAPVTTGEMLDNRVNAIVESRHARNAEVERLHGLLDFALKKQIELEAQNAALLAALEWLQSRGGLGLDVHERIRAAIEAAKQ